MSDPVTLHTLKFAEQKRRRRDPFAWILTAMGVTLLVGIPATWIAMLLDSRAASGLIFGSVVVAMAVSALASAAVAVSREGVTKHSLRDLFWLTLAAALSCAMMTYSNVLVRAGFLFALVTVVTVWWSTHRPSEKRSEYLLRLTGNFLLITVLVVVVVGGASTAFNMILHGRAR